MKYLNELADFRAISGREKPVREYIAGIAAEKGLYTRVDPMGNLLIYCKDNSLDICYTLIAAQMDESALLITGITEEGFIRFSPVGTVDEGVLPGCTVTVNGYPGVIGCKAIHHCSKEEREKAFPADQLYIDVGARTREEAEALVSPGDAAYFEGGAPFTCRAAGRYACALLMALMDDLPEDTALAFTVQGEVGHRGAAAAAFGAAPSRVIALDIADLTEAEGLAAGKGPAVPLADRRVVCDAALLERFTNAAKELNIPIQSPALLKGSHAAGGMQQAGVGAAAAMLLLPCRYANTPRAVVREEDFDAALRLLRAII